MLRLFNLEMILPINAIVSFRTMACMIATIESFNNQRKIAKLNSKSGIAPVQSYEKTNLKWVDIIKIYTKLSEVSVVVV